MLDRLAHTGDRGDREALRRMQQQLGALRAASERGDFSAIVRGAREFQELLRERDGE